jgi:hypothetical protein
MENIIKSWFTTLLGIAIMGFSFYGWYTEWLTDYQGGGAGIAGFAIMWMRDTISKKLEELFSAIIDRIRNKP